MSSPKSILLVDDDRELRGALAELLRLEGYLVSEAGNGLEALRLIRSAASLPQHDRA